MDTYVIKGQQALKYGYTTGSCAAASAKAATRILLMNEDISEVRLTTPKGITLSLEVCDIEKNQEVVSCAIVKDAGDDPDVTHGMKIYAGVRRRKEQGILIEGGVGIGRVTMRGLACPVGSAAINPVPYSMIEEAVRGVCDEAGYTGGIEVTIYAPKGEEVAKKTFNPRLGIIGGISILGTSGIVEPMSERALIDTIKAELDVQYAAGKRRIVICPGNYGIDFAKKELGLDLNKAIKYSNYLGEALDYITYLGFEEVLVVGHVGKLVKVAAGIMNTHSRYADGRFEVLAAHGALCGCQSTVIKNVMESVTTEEALRYLKETGRFETIMQSVMNKIKMHIDFRVQHKVNIQMIMFSNEMGVIAKSDQVLEILKNYQMEEQR